MKKLKAILAAFAYLSATVLFAQEQHTEKGIKFETGTWAEITAKAKKENKMIFLDAYASWCGPCKWMAKNVFTNDTVAEFYNKNFINAKIDMEKGEGVELAKKYGVQAYPTLFYINPEGEQVHRICGARGTSAFVTNGKDAMDPSKQLLASDKKFATGNYEAGFVSNYFTLLSEACMNPEKQATEYLKSQKETDLKSRNNWNIINNFITDHQSPAFKYLVANKSDFETLYTKDSVNDKITDVYVSALIRPKSNDAKEYENLKTIIKNTTGDNAEKILATADMNMYKRKKDWTNYAKAAERYVKSNPKVTSDELNSIAWTYYEHVDDKAMLAKAEAWAKQSVDMNSEYANNDTYAAVLYKLGKKAEAEKAAVTAIELAKKENADAAETEVLLNKIREMK